jgi:hypothetical protein
VQRQEEVQESREGFAGVDTARFRRLAQSHLLGRGVR